jgi:hypothetical protein
MIYNVLIMTFSLRAHISRGIPATCESGYSIMAGASALSD